jgi:hypothetical protein
MTTLIASTNRFLLAALVAMMLAPGAGAQGHFDPPDDMIVGARLIVLATVDATSAQTDPRSYIVYTYVRFTITSCLKGTPPASRLVLRERGGQDRSSGTVYEHQPLYAKGERLLLFLTTWPDGALRTYALDRGKIPISVGRDGDAVLPAPTTGKPQPSHDAHLSLSDYETLIRERLEFNSDAAANFEARYFSSIPVLPAPPEYRGSR